LSILVTSPCIQTYTLNERIPVVGPLRRLFGLAVATALVVLIGLAWQERLLLWNQYRSYRVGAAASYRQAQGLIDRMHDDAAMPVLVSKWGTGNARFDVYLARYLNETHCPDTLREEFAQHIGRSPELASRWAHLWRFRALDSPAGEYRQLANYLRILCESDERLPITWRDVLDAQALFIDSDQRVLARGLDPAHLKARFRQWQAAVGSQPGFWLVSRPGRPFADWPDGLPVNL
jgi:hypothetical protein